MTTSAFVSQQQAATYYGTSQSSLSGTPTITIGPRGSGATFEPANTPVVGDGPLGTDCIAAIAAAFNAAIAAPYGSLTRPAKISFLAGTYPCYVVVPPTGPLLIQSGVQVIEGAGKQSTEIDLKQAAQTTITPPASASTYTNTAVMPLYVRIIPGTETTGSAVTTGNTKVAYSGISTAQVTGIYLLAPNDTLTLTYSGGTPTMDSSYPFLAYNVAPSKGPSVKGFQINTQTNSWGVPGIDFAYNPNGTSGGNAAYAEAGNSILLQEFRVTGTNAALVADIVGDGIEGGCIIQSEARTVEWCVPLGELQVFGSSPFNTFATMGQTVEFFGSTFNAPVTVRNNNIQGSTMGVNPCNLSFYGAYFNGSTAAGGILIQNNQASASTVITIVGGFWKGQGAVNAYIKGNEATTYINLLGGTTFNKTAGTTPLVSTVPAGVFVQGPVFFTGAATAASFFANTIYSGNTTGVGAGFSSPFIVHQASSLASTATVTLTYNPPLVAGGYRFTLYVKVTTAGTSTIPTLSYHDENGATVTAEGVSVMKITTGAFVQSMIATGYYGIAFPIDTDNSGSAITMVLTPTGSTFNYDYTLERVR